MLKGYTYRLHPTPAQAEFLIKTAGFPVFKSRRRSRASYTTNNQYGTIRIETGKVRLPKVGFDLGLDHFAVMTNDAMVSEKIDNPRFLRQSEATVKEAQRALSRKKIGSKNREKAKLLLAKKHEKIANQRKDFLHKLSRRIVDENRVIVVETLKAKDMMKNHKVAKSIGMSVGTSSSDSWNTNVPSTDGRSSRQTPGTHRPRSVPLAE